MHKDQESIDSGLSLQGVGVLVTRPREQAEEICRQIESLGGEAIRFPVLEILDPENREALNAIIDTLDQFDLAIFISPNAVQRALNLVAGRRSLPAHLKIAAIGRSSARELKQAGYHVDLFPKDRFNSEALLEMPDLKKVQGKRIVIFRGEGGRELLAETLRQRGAIVEYAEVYRRALPQADTGDLLRRWARDEVNVVIVTSNDALRNLYELVGKLGREWLRKTPLVVISDRMLQLAKELGIKAPIEVAAQPSDAAIVEAIQKLNTRISTGK